MCKFIFSAVCSTLAVCLCTANDSLSPSWSDPACLRRCPAMRPSLQRRSEQPGDEWAAKFSSRRWQPPTGSMHDCHWQLQRSLWWKTSVTWQRLQLRSFLVTCFFLPCPDSSKEAGLVRTHMQGFCRAGLFWKSWVYFFCEVVKHELKMRLEFCYHIVVLALNNKKLDLFTSQPTAYFYATFLLSNTPTPFCR